MTLSLRSFISFLTSLVSLSACTTTIPQTALQPSRLEQRVSALAPADHMPQKYAVLINGNPTSSFHMPWEEPFGIYYDNMSLAYTTLTQLGYAPEHVFVLESDGSRASSFGRGIDRKTHIPYPVDGPATCSTVTTLFQSLAHTLDSSDTLWVYTSDHGGLIQEGDHTLSTIILQDEDLTQRDFSFLLATLPSTLIYFGDQCYSGGFVDQITTSRRYGTVAFSATSSDLPSHGSLFTRYFFQSLQKEDSDDSYSLLQSFDHACQTTPAVIDQKQIPHYVEKKVYPK